MKLIINEEQYNNLELFEAENPAYLRSNAKEDNLKQIWAAIDAKQKKLYQQIFGNLSEKIYDITMAKSQAMNKVKPNVDFKQIPRNMFTAGNTKLPPSVLIVNMSSALMCPSYYLGLCHITQGACYAMKDENQYSQTKRGSVLKNNWERDLMHTQMLQQYQNGNTKPMDDFFRLLETYIQLGNAYAENLFKKELEKQEYRFGRELTEDEKYFLRVQQSDTKITDIRLNESGDFQCQLAVDLWAKFARKIKKKYGINTHAYTARNFDFSQASQDMAINYSHGGDGNQRGEMPRMFVAVSKEEYDELQGGDKVKNKQPILGQKENGTYFYKCPCTSDQSTCDRCGVCFAPNKTNKPYTVYVQYHSSKNAKGLKNLLTVQEYKKVMDALVKNKWATEKEIAKSKDKNVRKKLQNFSNNVLVKRNEQ